ncbi:hypothetical protein [Microbacterium sp. LMI1-1-1.1]|uniref:hypothetical protein n=1 Tax=Microbacterium sp. LMI1-1-1.1 TaxID=3135223 RepID=UPI0034673ED2
MRTVVKAASIAKPEPAAQAFLVILPVVIGGALAVGGVIHGLLLGRSAGEVVFWLAVAVVYPTTVLLIFASTRRSLGQLAAVAGDAGADVTVYTFAEGGSAYGIDSWRDWKDTDRLGEGLLILSTEGLELRSSDVNFAYAFSQVRAVEAWYIWSRFVWAPQICVYFNDGRTAVLSPAHTGWKAIRAFSRADLRAFEQDLERRAPGITTRGE